MIISPQRPFLPENWRTLPEEDARRYLFKIRWRLGFRCPRCKNNDAWETKRGLYSCSDCNHQVSVTAGTIFHGTHKPLTLWFRAIWWLTGQKNGASAVSIGISRVISYPFIIRRKLLAEHVHRQGFGTKGT